MIAKTFIVTMVPLPTVHYLFLYYTLYTFKDHRAVYTVFFCVQGNGHVICMKGSRMVLNRLLCSLPGFHDNCYALDSILQSATVILLW